MSDIVIRGIEMPKGNDYLHLIIQNGKVHTAISCGHLTTDELNIAEAIELPPHGRLGDLDLMKENFAESLRITRQQVELDSDSPFYGLQQRDLVNAEKLVNGLIGRTPTVLEASEVKE